MEKICKNCYHWQDNRPNNNGDCCATPPIPRGLIDHQQLDIGAYHNAAAEQFARNLAGVWQIGRAHV